MKHFIYSNSYLIILILLPLFNYITTTYRQDAYDYFDPYYLSDTFGTYSIQTKSSKCTIADGPNCFFLSKLKKSPLNSTLSKLNPALTTYKSLDIINKGLNSEIEVLRTPKKTPIIEDESIKNIINDLQEKNKNQDSNQNVNKDDNKKSTLDPNQNTKPSSFQIQKEIELKLTLTFESYDEKTKENDIYLPSEIKTDFSIGYIKITVSGKMRLTQKNQVPYFKNININDKDEFYPKDTFGIIETDRVILSFHAPMRVVYLFIKKSQNDLDRPDNNFVLYGVYKNKKIVLARLYNVGKDQWHKVYCKDTVVDYIILEKGFDVDNIQINYKFLADITDQVMQGNNQKMADYIKSELEKRLKNKNDEQIQKEMNDLIKDDK